MPDIETVVTNVVSTRNQIAALVDRLVGNQPAEAARRLHGIFLCAEGGSIPQPLVRLEGARKLRELVRPKKGGLTDSDLLSLLRQHGTTIVDLLVHDEPDLQLLLSSILIRCLEFSDEQTANQIILKLLDAIRQGSRGAVDQAPKIIGFYLAIPDWDEADPDPILEFCYDAYPPVVITLLRSILRAGPDFMWRKKVEVVFHACFANDNVAVRVVAAVGLSCLYEEDLTVEELREVSAIRNEAVQSDESSLVHQLVRAASADFASSTKPADKADILFLSNE